MANEPVSRDVLDALKGSDGTPDDANRFVTQSDPNLDEVNSGTAFRLAQYDFSGEGLASTPFEVSGDDLVPAGGDNTGRLGTPSARFAGVYANDVISGDLHLARNGDPEEGEPEAIYWRIREYEDGLRVRNMITGKEYKIALIPIEESS